VNHGRTVRAPTGVGFCMFVKREVLNKVGFLDADTFGRGYGEENDLCLRGQAAGYHDLIAGGIFVRHLGSVSFQGEKSELIRKNLAILNARWPNYHRDVMRYLDEDPVRALRANIDLGRLKLQRRRRNVMVISHYDRGGGSEQAVQEEIDRLTREGVGVYRLRSVSAGEQLFHMHPHVGPAPNMRSLHLYSDMDEILSLWSDLYIDEIHIHHLIDFGPDGVRHITTLLERYGRPFRFVLHDYFPICPRIHLHQSDGFYCGEPVNASACNQCLIGNGSPFGGADIEAWREDYRRLFAAADMLIAPDADVVNRMQRYFRGDNYYVRPHEHVQIKSVTPSAPVVGRPIRVVTLGAISDIKGYHVLLGCAEHARHHSLPIEFHVVGYTMDDAKAKAAGVSVSGPYDGDFALEALLVARPDIVLLGAVWPETYSYTLSVALRSGLPTWVFDIGAPARRLREAGVGKILPLSMARNYGAINAAIMAEFAINA
jgi:glycosyltransferase involved in cell wall biosynthesis